MPEPILKYDTTDIPAVYDRARDHGPGVLDLWMRAVDRAMRGRGAIESILDLGCGTGRFSSGLAEFFDADVLGIDPSRRMLAQACSKPHGPRVRYNCARGEAIPLPDRQCDLIFISMVFHHFASPEDVAAECRRVLRRNGVVFMRTGTADRVPWYPYVPFFPASLPLLYDILPTTAHVREVFESAGFRTVGQDLIVQEIAATHARYADKLEAGGDSVLVRLDPADLERGLAMLRAHAATVDPRPVTEPIDTFVFA
jgi:ubiquinone/menaquinone biosynthesis C-methylase UbiE